MHTLIAAVLATSVTVVIVAVPNTKAIDIEELFSLRYNFRGLRS